MKNWLLVSKIVLLIFFKVLPAIGQNLIYNGNFEQVTACPTNENQLYKAVGWSSPTLGTPDLMCTCSSNNMVSLPSNLTGYQNPYNGTCFAHFLVDIDYLHEYLTFELKSNLKRNATYEVAFRINLANNSRYCLDQIGVYFSSTKPVSSTIGKINVTPRFTSPKGFLLCDTINWTVIKDTIVADGSERYFSIGQFLDKDSLSLFYFSNSSLFWAYYYVDGIEVNEVTINPELSVPNIFSPNEDGVNDLLTISIAKAQTATIQIFNRWGSVVFESTDLEPIWDGTFNGNPVADGVYFVVVQATGSGGAQTTETQTVHLIR